MRILQLLIIIIAGKLLYTTSCLPSPNGVSNEQWSSIQGGCILLNFGVIYCVLSYNGENRKAQLISKYGKTVEHIRVSLVCTVLLFALIYIHSVSLLGDMVDIQERTNTVGLSFLLAVLYSRFCHRYSTFLQKVKSGKDSLRGIINRYATDTALWILAFWLITSASQHASFATEHLVTLIF